MAFILKSVDMVTGSMIDRKDFRKRYIKEVMKDEVQVEEYWYLCSNFTIMLWIID